MLPLINKEICTDCQLCVNDCVARAITKENKDIIANRCILCSHCTAICPVEAITINGTSGEKLSSLSEDFSSNMETLVKGRRSIRTYKEKTVSKEIIRTVLNTVVHAPTGTNSRKVSITVLDSREKIEILTDILMNHFDKITRLLLNPLTWPILFLFVGRNKTEKLFNYKKLIRKYGKGKNILTHDAPLLMIFHVDKSSSSPSQDGIIWSTTAMYVAESHGLGTCFNGFLVIGLNTCRKARKYLGIPKGNRIAETFTAGYPVYTYKRSAVREDLDVVFI